MLYACLGTDTPQLPQQGDFPTPQRNRLQHDRPAACVITQKDSSATLVSLRLNCHKEEFGADLINCVISVFFF
jgi:hypothetical protein